MVYIENFLKKPKGNLLLGSVKDVIKFHRNLDRKSIVARSNRWYYAAGILQCIFRRRDENFVTKGLCSNIGTVFFFFFGFSNKDN